MGNLFRASLKSVKNRRNKKLEIRNGFYARGKTLILFREQITVNREN